MSRRVAKRDKFAELRELRQSGKKKTYDVGEVDELYEEVDENQYKKIVRDRLNEDDFVVDDNGEGYADDGREEWDRLPQYGDDSEEELGLPGSKVPRKSKKQKEQEDAKRDANDRDITEYFTKGAAKAPPKQKVIKTEEDDKFLEDLLGEVTANIPTPTTRVSKKRERSVERRKVRVLSPVREPRPPMAKRAKTVDDRASSPAGDEDLLPNDDYPAMDDEPAPVSDYLMSDAILPSSPAAKVATRRTFASRPEPKKDEDDDDEDEDMMEVAHTGAVTAASVNISASRQVKKIPKADPVPASSSPARAPLPEVDAASWNEINQKLNVVSMSQPEGRSVGKIDYKDAIEEDGSLNMFWTDYTEVNGSLCLFGKVLNKKTKNYVSCFVKVDNILRKLFFLPRKYRVRGGEETTEEVEMMDVYNEVDEIMTKMNVGMHKIKACTRKYAFELPDVPKEGQYLKLLYPYTKPAMDPITKGETFSHVFGTNTALFEQFVLWKNIMGPCWLKIEDADFTSLRNASHCKLEILVDHPMMVSVPDNAESIEPPPLTLMSLAMRTAFNPKDNKQEILAVSARVYFDVSLSDTTPADKLPSRSFTCVRPYGSAFPIGFETLAKERKRGMLKLFKQEHEILNFLLAQIDVIDPDVILGHQLEGVDYSILLNRLHEKKTHQWSRLGRLRRSQWPSSIVKMGGNVFAERQVMSGRLLCDLANDAGKSVMTKCQTWSLTEMCSLYLGAESRRRDIDNEVALKTWANSDKNGLMDYISHVETDTYFIAALALRTQILPLTKVLTNLAGNSWARTLTGTRAERNEYILLHEFHRNKYVVPDKQTFKGRQRIEEENAEEEGGEGGKKKDKYKGGLVFEPEKGLYDKFVLVMDFNSLYPSIIQEYNICFTTVDRTSLTGQVSDEGQNATPEELATWDIKQLALKLTANSMYGCLGYTKSRFYARPLAVLTTYKGREILRSTKELAESNSLQVIYGDTDSVMINANKDNVADALRVGHEFKKAVNERYRLLEIDIDNVFRRILLQAKKEEISNRILTEILSGDDTELSVQRIHEYLRDISCQDARECRSCCRSTFISTQLGKAPKDYPNADSMPQVQVALRELAKGKTIRKGDVISYIITGDSKGTSEPVAKRAYTPQDVLKADSGRASLRQHCRHFHLPTRENLGLDVRKYSSNNSHNSSGPQDLEIHPLESQIPDSLRFQSCTRLSLRCRRCKTSSPFEGLTSPASVNNVTPSGIQCPSCQYVLPTLSVVAQVEAAVRAQTARYYEGWLVCDDSSCGNRTRQISVYGTRCLGSKGLAHGECSGRMRYEYTERDIYNQLVYFASLWDVDRAKSKAKEAGDDDADAAKLSREEKERVAIMAEHNRVRFGTVKGVVEKYLDKCGRRWVAMDTLFAKLGEVIHTVFGVLLWCSYP
ncbi:hypothetical protein B0T20DRAFT_405745 [Sordaria brevicollis]|uniref:DNA polymerase n=1 Tax=Sordaria brevicollis TaxID=83679 RepID=A0AAE0PJ33_SORBR|nr:hypothetical protein B0T20DRAFT_405745 [Sordaria brevicollis]